METTRLVEPEIGPPFAQQDAVKTETTNPGKPQVSEKATESHALANESVNAGADDHGALAKPFDEDLVEVRDLGWNNEDSQVAQPVVNGISNEQLWKLVRRFDKQTFHVKSISKTPLANLDMNIAEDEEFSPEKLRAHLERLYTSVAVQLMAFYQHILRLRSWRERRRTITFFGVYFTAWFLDILLPTLVAFLIVLIMIPKSRGVCFPFAPPALISSATGGVQKPPAGVLGSDDTITGAPESHDGEGAEQEANSFVTNIATVSPLVDKRLQKKYPLTLSSCSSAQALASIRRIPPQAHRPTSPYPTRRRYSKTFLGYLLWTMIQLKTKPSSQFPKLCGPRPRHLCMSFQTS